MKTPMVHHRSVEGTEKSNSPTVVKRADAKVAAGLPTWPMTAMFALYPLWWVIGVADIAWIGTSTVMGLYLLRLRNARAPMRFGVWLAFLLWMTFSVIELDTPSRLLAFGFHSSHYFAITILLLYVYNARTTLTDRFVTGSVTIFWGIVVLGGFLGMLLPSTVFRTPPSYILPQFLLENQLVRSMVVRRFAQFDPNSIFSVPARPSAPFLFTNNWGNAYSMLIPFVVAYMYEVRGEKKFWLCAFILPISLIPAVATQNRGMFIGLAIATLYVSLRLTLRGEFGVVLIGLGLAATVASVVLLSPAQEQLNSRVETTGTTEARARVYAQTLEAVRDSPLLGYGGSRPSANPNNPPVGSHGQFWIVMHSHGIPALLFFMTFLISCFLASLRRVDAVGLLSNTVILVGMVETLFYGFLPSGLYLLFLACGLAMRGHSPDERRT